MNYELAELDWWSDRRDVVAGCIDELEDELESLDETYFASPSSYYLDGLDIRVRQILKEIDELEDELVEIDMKIADLEERLGIF